MSGVVKSVKKVFKKVLKVVKKLAPVILAAAAIYFTAGAALGIAGTAGGWGGAVSGLMGKLGLGSTLGGIVTGAVTQAGYGAVLGGAFAAVTGGDVGKGLLRGAIGGAVTGGVMGGLGLPTDPLSGIGETPATAASNATSLNAPITPVTSAPIGPIGPVTAPPPPSGGLLSNIGAFIEKNPTVAGMAIQGLGSGIGGLAQADAEIEAAQIKAEQDALERAQIAANFGVGEGGGLLTGTTFDTTPRPTPLQQFNINTMLAKAQGAMWRYNPATGQLELLPTA